jgi:uroporphyrinogen decarboxylase
VISGRERFLTAIANKKPDRLPCQVHNWMEYYLKTYLGGVDQFGAYERFGMDPVIYTRPDFTYSDSDMANWRIEDIPLPAEPERTNWRQVIHTPDGDITAVLSKNQFTYWYTENLIKSEQDFEIWNKYVPLPTKIDWAPVREARKKIGDSGIVRGGFFDFGQGSPWQSFCILHGTEESIMAAIDKPDWIHYALRSMLDKKLKVIEIAGRIELDLVETGGGAGSSTVISPDFHKTFCLPYDQIQHKALHAAGTKTVYHLCGGLMPLLEIVVQNGTNGLETMTPPAMGGDCDLAEAARRVGDKLFFIGGFDQNKGFENGDPAAVRQMVFDLFKARPQGGYICSPSDHFFFGPPENIKAFAEAAKECIYT